MYIFCVWVEATQLGTCHKTCFLCFYLTKKLFACKVEIFTKIQPMILHCGVAIHIEDNPYQCRPSIHCTVCRPHFSVCHPHYSVGHPHCGVGHPHWAVGHPNADFSTPDWMAYTDGGYLQSGLPTQQCEMGTIFVQFPTF